MGLRKLSSAYVHAALLLHFAKQSVSEENLTKVITAAGMQADVARIKALASAISEVNIEEAIKSAPLGFAPQPPPAQPTEASKPAEAKKEEKKEEKKKEEEALAGLGALFG
jgi:large subunit ribosomal protein L12